MTYNEIIGRFSLYTTSSSYPVCVEMESDRDGHCTVRFGNSYTLTANSPDELLELSKRLQAFAHAVHACSVESREIAYCGPLGYIHGSPHD